MLLVDKIKMKLTSNILTKTNFNSSSDSYREGVRGSIIELLSPAKNLECGLAAINHGADAVYIGASQFGARAAAGNSIEDIETLVKYAHQYRSKIFVALNTILTDDQLPEAEKLIHQIYNAGADALIIQDIGILKMNLPPIALHASTQTDNRTLEKVRFLQDVGFSRVVLARELTLKQIEEISLNTNVELEAFVHGALCVSYSGQCYMSHANSGRSANRGQCAQYCRLPYNLTDADENILAKNKHLLSLKDLDLSDSLEEMMKAGIMSFKIEGRLKDADYVKNITAFYRKKIDTILEGNSQYKKSSIGKTTFFFEPNPEKSFRRGNTDYFLHGRHKEIIQPNTPKSMGEPIGKVKEIGEYYFTMSSAEKLSNGDGLCFINAHGDLTGFRVNKVDGRRVYPADMPKLIEGSWLYRNQDQAFEKIMKGKTAERKIGVHILFQESSTGFSIQFTDEFGISTVFEVECEKQPAQKPEVVNDNIRNQLSKMGNTIYEVESIDIQISSPWFFPTSILSDWRRQAIERLDEKRKDSYVRESQKAPIPTEFPLKKLTYLGNVTNKLSEDFYREHGVEEIHPGFEVKAEEGVPLMFTKHCIKYEMGWCPREGHKPTFKEPLYLRNNDQRYELRFDCAKCEVLVVKTK